MSHARDPINVLSILDARVVTGPARGLIHLARHLPPWLRLHVAVLRDRGAGPLPPLEEHVSGGRLTVWPLVEHGSYDPGVIVRARDLARKLDARIVQSHSYKPHVIALAVRAMYGAPWIGFHHGWTAENLKVRLFHVLDHLTLPRADRIVAVSRSSEQLVLGVGCPRERTVMITNAVDPADLASDVPREAARRELGIPPDATVLAAVGRLSHEKGQDVLLAAFAQLAEAPHRTLLVLAGDGPDAAALRSQARALRIEGRVRFLGHQTNVARVYAAADLLALPSRSEAMPNALLEAMCAGVPAVATDVGGVAEVATHGETAWVVPGEDPAALAAALSDALTHPAERKRRASLARRYVEQALAPARRAERFVALYHELLGDALDPYLAPESVSERRESAAPRSSPALAAR
jgi:glycosyltransferase involved in cell wall biosynthesis